MRSMIAAVAALLVVSAAAAAQEQKSAWQMVWESEEAAERLSVEGRARTRALLGREERDAVARVRASQGRVRFDYEGRGRRWSLIDDGRELIRLDPGRQEALVLPRATVATDRRLAERNYEAKVVGEARVAGRQTRIVELSPRGREGVVQRLWLDRETSFVLKRERYNAGGRVTAGTEYLEVAFGSSVPAGAFAVPPDWRRVGPDGRGPRLTLAELGRKAGFAVRAPQYVPPGYELLGGYVAEGGRWHVRMAELRYTDGLRVLSVFERARESMDSGRGMGPPGRGRGRALGRGRRGRAPERGRGRGGGFGPPDGREITLMDRGSEKALRYFGSELVIVVVGDLTAEELTRIAKSVG